MATALFFNVPAHGHINPSLPLVSELVRRGYDITYFTTESYRDRVAATGAQVEIYTGIEDDYFDSRGLNGTIPQKAALALLTTAKAILPDLIEYTHHAKPDLILYDCMCPWGYYLAKIMRLPSVSSFSLLPPSARSMLSWQVMRVAIPMLRNGFAAGQAATRLGRDLAKQYGVKPLGMMNVLIAPGDLVVAYSSTYYVPFAHTLPDNYRFIGWTVPTGAADPAFERDSSRPLIYISLGTVSNDNADFYRTCLAALGDAPYDVLISTGGRFTSDHFGTLPDNIRIETWVPQTQVLRQATVFVTHGGLNSIHEGLACDVPLLIVPQQAEQTINGLRVVDLAAGLMLKPNAITAESLHTQVDTLLTDHRYRQEAMRVGKTLREAGGAAYAANEIDKLLRVSRRQPTSTS